MNIISVEHGDILTTVSDVLVLKYAQGFHGADLAVANALDLSERTDDALTPGKYIRIPTRGKLGCKRVFFIGVPSLWKLGYAEIRRFSKDALTILAEQDCERDSIALTIHGVGYGLDEREAFTAEVAGLMEYLASPETSWRPKRIAIIERDVKRAARMNALLSAILSESGIGQQGRTHERSTRSLIPDAGITSESKQHVFVAMPFAEEMEDVYEFGIQEPINAAGCLCERCDRSVFIGDVLDRIKRRITSSQLVLADMTGANPNVYLEVGYAWGRDVPTLLLARKGEELKFDVRSHRCIYYASIAHLRKQLTELLPQLIGSTPRPTEFEGGGLADGRHEIEIGASPDAHSRKAWNGGS